MSFTSNFERMANMTNSENGGRTFRSTGGGDLLNLYSQVGSMRSRDASEIVSMWRAARKENPELADNLVLYARGIRNGGAGERRTGRILLKELAKVDPNKIERNFDTIVEAGRWDDLWIFIDTPVENAMWAFVEKQFNEDVINMRNNKPISLLAKWACSINTSSAETRNIAKRTCSKLGLTFRTYRKTLSALRRYIDVVERKMSAGQWDKINFEGVPSVAMNRYISAFNNHLPEKFQAYKDALTKGEAKVNAGALFPYDITQKFLRGRSWDYSTCHLDTVDEEQWKNLPNYVDGTYDVLVLADVSGSMFTDDGRPMATSIGLATYFAQRNKGAYHGKYLTFTNHPEFIQISDNWTLEDTLRYVLNAGVGYSTDLDRAMLAIFEVAKISHEAPKALVVVSDMEINPWYSGDYCESIVSKWTKKYETIGLKAPKIILWNVESRGGRTLAPQTDNVGYVSGYGVAPFKSLTTLLEKSAYEAMVDILSQDAFQWK